MAIKEKLKNDQNNLISKLLKLLSSRSIHFILGAGFNNNFLPLAKDLLNTIAKIKDTLNLKDDKKIDNIEEWINEQIQVHPNKRTDIETAFLEGLKEDLTLDNNETYKDILKQIKQIDNEKDKEEKTKQLEEINLFLKQFKKIVLKSSNGNGNNSYIKKVFFWTLNYDNLLQKLLVNNKMPHFVIDHENWNSNIIDFSFRNDQTKIILPSYFIYKIHGNKNKPIIPANTKFANILEDQQVFEAYIKMKTLLMDTHGKNLVFIIGYSGNDLHIEQIIGETISNNNQVIYVNYDEKEQGDFNSVEENNVLTIKTSQPLNFLTELFGLILEKLGDENGK
ncbi:hypothetical protein ELUMI_v1c04210 [Williamsoniiplasma luminosum]|uniref:Uncharacterized protein n=1 Tax=Williamsoniiplasma luminosum TaxID=214888 RepID=A0A2K8NTG9_9MOLU|nr:SIR2 family protein [Williamsoniiplasma luminosum]ATZ17145.1 hypothetical protein ELUMI_v1c04210 [Williamsoniiplasma luminosum]